MSNFAEHGIKNGAQIPTHELNHALRSNWVLEALCEASDVVYLAQDVCVQEDTLLACSEPLETSELLAIATRAKVEFIRRDRESDEAAITACDMLLVALLHPAPSEDAHKLLVALMSQLAAEICKSKQLDEHWRDPLLPLARLTMPDAFGANDEVKPGQMVSYEGWKAQVHRVRIPAYVDKRSQAFLPTIVLNLPMGENGEPVDSDWNYIDGWSNPPEPKSAVQAANWTKYTVHVEYRVAGWDQGWDE